MRSTTDSACCGGTRQGRRKVVKSGKARRSEAQTAEARGRKGWTEIAGLDEDGVKFCELATLSNIY